MTAGMAIDPTEPAPSARRRGRAMGDDASPPGGAVDRPPAGWRRWLVRALVASGTALLFASPWWGPRALAELDFFHVRRIELEGVRYAKGGELVRLLAVDTTQSVWQSLPAVSARLLAHPLVAGASIERRLPGTLLVRVVERQPVALVESRGMLRPTDVTGTVLPIDLTATPVDAPVVATADTTLLRVLDGLRAEAPTLYARIAQAQRPGRDELRFVLGSLVVRTRPDVTVERFRDILPVEADLARTQLRAVELDLRFRQQVIARQP